MWNKYSRFNRKKVSIRPTQVIKFHTNHVRPKPWLCLHTELVYVRITESYRHTKFCKNKTAVLSAYRICMQSLLLFQLHIILYALKTPVFIPQPNCLLGLFCDVDHIYILDSTKATEGHFDTAHTFFYRCVLFKRTIWTFVLNAYKLPLSSPVSLFGCEKNFSRPYI